MPHYNKLLFKYVFAGDNVYGKRNRHGARSFSRHIVTTVGMLEAIFAHYLPTIRANNRFVFIRLLDQVDQGSENASVVNQFGNLRYKYAPSNSGFIHTVLVNASCLIQPVILAVDPYLLKQKHGLQKHLIR